MRILVDGYKVTKQLSDKVVLFDYQVTDSNNITICVIELGEKRNKFLYCCHATSTMLDAVHKKEFYTCKTSAKVKRAIKLAKIKRKELLLKNVVMIKG